MRLVTGTAAVAESLRRSLAGDGVTAPLPPPGPEREQTLAMLRPDRPVTEPGAAAIVATSGSTGHPRGVVLPRVALIASAEATHRRLGGPGTWVLALPTHYVAGLMVLVRAAVAGRPVREVDSRLDGLRGIDLGADPAYLSLVPTQLTRALDDPDLTRALTGFQAVLLGGAAADPMLLERARAAGIPVVTTYGMSETCGGCVYDGLPLDGVEVATDADGRLVLGGPTVFASYRLDPVATAEALRGGRLVTRDRGEITEGRVVVLGRVDDVIVSGGVNVDLAAVERAVRGWTGGEAAVVGVPSAEWGTEVVAVVEDGRFLPGVLGAPPAPGGTSYTRGIFRLSALRAALARALPSYALPRRLVVRPELPRTSGGKIDRRQLITDLTASPVDRPEDPT